MNEASSVIQAASRGRPRCLIIYAVHNLIQLQNFELGLGKFGTNQNLRATLPPESDQNIRAWRLRDSLFAGHRISMHCINMQWQAGKTCRKSGSNWRVRHSRDNEALVGLDIDSRSEIGGIACQLRNN